MARSRARSSISSRAGGAGMYVRPSPPVQADAVAPYERYVALGSAFGATSIVITVSDIPVPARSVIVVMTATLASAPQESVTWAGDAGLVFVLRQASPSPNGHLVRIWTAYTAAGGSGNITVAQESAFIVAIASYIKNCTADGGVSAGAVASGTGTIAIPGIGPTVEYGEVIIAATIADNSGQPPNVVYDNFVMGQKLGIPPGQQNGAGSLYLTEGFATRHEPSTYQLTGTTDAAWTGAAVSIKRRGIWITREEIMALPATGGAWNNVKNQAIQSNWGVISVAVQNSLIGGRLVGAAMAYVRDPSIVPAGYPNLRDRVVATIMAAKRSCDEPAEYSASTTHTQWISFHVGSVAIAADIIGMSTFDPADEVEIRTWLASIRSQVTTGNATLGNSINLFSEKTATGYAGLYSRLAVGLYLDDYADVQNCDDLFQAFCGDRSKYHGISGTYFAKSGCLDPSWLFDSNLWTGISPPATLQIRDAALDPPGTVLIPVQADGAGVEGISRSCRISNGISDCPQPDSCTKHAVWPPDSVPGDGNSFTSPSMGYSWTHLSSWFPICEMLHRAGKDSYGYSIFTVGQGSPLGGGALKRWMDFMVRAGFYMEFVSMRFIPWIANKRYGTNYTVLACSIPTWSMGWTDWTHQ